MSTPNLYQRIADNTISRNARQKAIDDLRKTINHDKKRIASHERKVKRLQNSLLPCLHQIEPESLDFGSAVDKKEAPVIKTIALRMTEARMICDLTITESAALIGVAQADLKRIEFSKDIFKLPLWVLRRATEIYSVPFDYLCGLIDDFDLADPEVFHGRNFFAALQRQEYENFAKLAAEQIRQNDQLKALSSSVCSAIVAQQYVSEVLAGFIRLNQGFDDMPGGARVLRQVKMAENLTQQATAALTKYRCLPEIPVEQAEIISKIFPNN